MSFTLKIKTKETNPTAGQLAVGEFGYNSKDKKVFIGNGSSAPLELARADHNHDSKYQPLGAYASQSSHNTLANRVDTHIEAPNPHGITKSTIGLGNVENKSVSQIISENKLVSTTYVEQRFNDLIGAAPSSLDTLIELANALNNDPNFHETVLSEVGKKANKATTLAGYGIGDAYTKSQVNSYLSQKSDTGHGHVIDDITGLQTALNGKSNTGHTHSWTQITGKPTTFTPSSHTHTFSDISGSIPHDKLPYASQTQRGAIRIYASGSTLYIYTN